MSENNNKYLIGALIIGAVILATLVALPSFWAFNQMKTAAESRKAAYNVLHEADSLISALLTAEIEHYNFIFTGDDSFLNRYPEMHTEINDRLYNLRQLSKIEAAHTALKAIEPLVTLKLAKIEQNIALRIHKDKNELFVFAFSKESELLTNSIIKEMETLIVIELDEIDQRNKEFQTTLQSLFLIIVLASLLSLIFALAIAGYIFKQTRQTLKNLVHKETQHLLVLQEATNERLRDANEILREKEENLAVTLNSIGDAVIVTDAEANVTRMNPIAENLTGWSLEDSKGRPIQDIFNIINQETRQKAAVPVITTLKSGTIQGLANHTILIDRNGNEYSISDSCAPIHDRVGEVIGAVLVFRDVSKTYAIEQALHDSTLLVRTVLDTVIDGIITIHARGGIIKTVNSAAEKMFGYTIGELKGNNFSMLIPELDKDQLNGTLEYYGASDVEKAGGMAREVWGKKKDGSGFPLEISISELTSDNERYFTGILRDISARKNAEKILVKENALQDAIFNSVNFSSIATDAKGVIQIFNIGAERMLGYTAVDVVNKITPADISEPQEIIARAKALSVELDTSIAPGFEALVFKASRGIEDIYELTYIRKNGTRFPAVVSVTALRDRQGTIIGYLLIGTDNTARGIVEADRLLFDQALQDKNDELHIAKIIAEKANLAKSDFLSSMSHELRTPLSAILGFAQLIESGIPIPTPAQKRSIDQILKAGWYLLELINEILDLTLIESGKLSLSIEPVSLAEVLHECQLMVGPQAKKRNIIVTFSQFETHFVVLADRMRLKQIIINLLSNAIKYNTENGTVTVLCTAAPPDSLHISIIDTGEGLAPEQIAQLFEPFNRLGKESLVEEGTGIGLVVCKRLIELMGGVICVESTVGQGSTFRIEMTLFDENKHLVKAGDSDEMYIPSEQDKENKFSLLYIEDNPANMMLVEDLIARRENIRLISATDGIHGIELARSELPDIILMDINLPGISGIDALKILIKDPLTAAIPVVALSANAIPRDIERGLEAGFFRYLTKPIKVNEFMGTLDLALAFAREGVKT